MSYYLRVFCSSNHSVPRRAILDFIEEGVYFDDPQFVPTAESPECDDPKWREFTVIYQQNKRPVIFYRDEGKEMSEDVKVATEALEAATSSMTQKVLVAK